MFDADHDPVRVADALRRSPHFRAADADPGGDTVWFTTEAGINYTLAFEDPEPTDDDLVPEPVLAEAIAAAILNHPGFVTADADSPREDTITIQSRNQVRHLLGPGRRRGRPVGLPAVERRRRPGSDSHSVTTPRLRHCSCRGARRLAGLSGNSSGRQGCQRRPGPPRQRHDR